MQGLKSSGMFALDEIDLRSGCLEIRVRGELDLAEAPQLEQVVKRASRYDQVVISLEECEFIDSTGIALIIHSYRERKREGQGLAVCGVSGQVQRVLELTGLYDHGLIFETAEAACAASEGAS
jgi:anti-anti-sigma factor